MAIHAAANIAMALEHKQNRGYAKLGGFILNKRNVKRETEKVEELSQDFHSKIVGSLSRSELVQEAEEKCMTVIEGWPDSEMAAEYRKLAKAVLSECAIEDV